MILCIIKSILYKVINSRIFLFLYFYSFPLAFNFYIFYELPMIQAGVMPKALPTFPDLRHLSILEVTISEMDLLWVATILKDFPELQRLELHVSFSCQIPKTNYWIH